MSANGIAHKIANKDNIDKASFVDLLAKSYNQFSQFSATYLYPYETFDPRPNATLNETVFHYIQENKKLFSYLRFYRSFPQLHRLDVLISLAQLLDDFIVVLDAYASNYNVQFTKILTLENLSFIFYRFYRNQLSPFIGVIINSTSVITKLSLEMRQIYMKIDYDISDKLMKKIRTLLYEVDGCAVFLTNAYLMCTFQKLRPFLPARVAVLKSMVKKIIEILITGRQHIDNFIISNKFSAPVALQKFAQDLSYVLISVRNFVNVEMNT